MLAYTEVGERFFIELITSINETCRVFKNQNVLSSGISSICHQIQTTNLEATLIENKIKELIKTNG